MHFFVDMLRELKLLFTYNDILDKEERANYNDIQAEGNIKRMFFVIVLTLLIELVLAIFENINHYHPEHSFFYSGVHFGGAVLCLYYFLIFFILFKNKTKNTLKYITYIYSFWFLFFFWFLFLSLFNLVTKQSTFYFLIMVMVLSFFTITVYKVVLLIGGGILFFTFTVIIFYHLPLEYLLEVTLITIGGCVVNLLVSYFYFKNKVTESRINKLSKYDGLTSFYNQFGFDEWCDKNFDYLNMTTTIVTINLDNFKEYNGLYGRFQGDVLLKKTAIAIKDAFNKINVVGYRYHDCFTLLLPHMKSKEARNICEALAKQIYILKQPSPKAKASPYMTVSIGISDGVIRNKADIRSMILTSLDALWIAKINGKNYIEVIHYNT